MRLQERGHLVRPLRILADRRDAHGAALRQRLQRRQFGDARAAPRRPQIDEHRLALERGEGGGLAVRPLERRARRGLPRMAAVDADLRGRGGRSGRFVGRGCVRIGRVRLPGGALCLSQPAAISARRQTIATRADMSGSNSMWGGRFAEGPAAVMREINASIPFDKRMWRQDIAGSKAHVAMLAKQGIVSAEDAAAIDAGLDTVAADYAANGVPRPRPRRHPHADRGEAGGCDRPRRRPPAHCAQPQRSGRDRFSACGCAMRSTRCWPR